MRFNKLRRKSYCSFQLVYFILYFLPYNYFILNKIIKSKKFHLFFKFLFIKELLVKKNHSTHKNNYYFVRIELTELLVIDLSKALQFSCVRLC